MVLYITFYNQSGSDILLQYSDSGSTDYVSYTLKKNNVLIEQNNLYRYWMATTVDTNLIILRFRSTDESSNYIIPSSVAILTDNLDYGDMHIKNELFEDLSIYSWN